MISHFFQKNEPMDILSMPRDPFSLLSLAQSFSVIHPNLPSAHLQPWWSFDKKTRVLLGRFDSDSDPFLSLPGYLAFKDIAVVTEGLINLDVTKCASEFVTTFMKQDNEAENLQAIEFESEIVNGRVIAKEDKSRSFVFTAANYAEYLENQKAFLKAAGDFANAAVADGAGNTDFVHLSKSNPVEYINVRKAYYLTDYDLSKSPSLEKAFEDGLHDVMKKMLPSSDWCLSHMVSPFSF